MDVPVTECSTAWAGLSAWGTATQASFWVALEQSGPWGRDALVESRLDPELGDRWGSAAAKAGGRLLLMRAPGQHVAEADFRSRRVFVAGGLAGSAWLLQGVALSEAQVDGLPWDAIGTGDRASVLEDCPWLRPSDPVLLVCTNAKRDRCCALRGRPIVDQLAAEGLSVWECSHTGGHRFAPTGVVLPLGHVVARLTPDLGRAVLDAAASGRFAVGALSEEHDRGTSHLPPREQAAVSWVRAHEGETDPIALAVVGDDGDVVTVQHADGRVWALTLEKVRGEELPESCGKPAKPSATWRVH
ncbi:MAG TPA: sucrase ferredoxin [Propionibacterium sp.]|nr:sucrase ferredoxin [Propionibacterium sp.]